MVALVAGNMLRFHQVAECLRRLVLGVLVGLLPSDSSAAPTVGIVVCLFYNFVFTANAPQRTAGTRDLASMLSFYLSFLFLASLSAFPRMNTQYSVFFMCIMPNHTKIICHSMFAFL